jgi:hypothetical protein
MRRPIISVLLIPWLLFGHGVPRRHVGAGDRVLSAASAADASRSPAFRVDDSRDLARTLGGAVRVSKVPPPHSSSGNALLPAWSCAVAPAWPSRWHAMRAGDFRSAWLIAPYDATAPPSVVVG